MKVLQSRLFRLIVTIFCLISILSLSRSIYGLWGRRDVVGERARVLSEVEVENRRLKDRLTQIDSPGFVEEEVRNKLGLVKEGEKVVLVPRQSGPSTGSGQAEENKDAELPNWKQWWKLFF